VATILSAQATDEQVNKITPSLFAKYKSIKEFAAANIEELQADIRSIGLFRNKALSIKVS
jgi:endonuclease-3